MHSPLNFLFKGGGSPQDGVTNAMAGGTPPLTNGIQRGVHLKVWIAYFDYITQCLAVDTISSLWKGEKENLKVKKNRKISLDLLGRPAGPTDPVKFSRGNRHDTNTPRTSISFF